jgi:hypothetical protein
MTLIGSQIAVWANGAFAGSAIDTSHTAAGKAGIQLGFNGALSASTEISGLHADNFSVTPLTIDSESANNWAYFGGPSLGVTGAISGDANTAVQFDGLTEHAQVGRQIQDDFSIEFWFKSTQGLNLSSQWWGNAGLVDEDVNGTANDFGVSLRSDGKVVAGVGNPDTSIVSTPSGLNNGSWHHVVFTRARASGALALYVDGAPAGTATGPTQSLNGTGLMSFGRILSGTNFFAGSLDEVAMYGSVLTPAAVAYHYNRR